VRQRGVARGWNVRGIPMAALAALSLAPIAGGPTHAQTPEVSPGGAIALGNRGWSASDPNRATSANELEFSARAGAASDYIYRGTTLSGHGPAVGAALEARFGALYAGTTVASVNLPTQPLAEFTFATGVRQKIATIDFDFGVTYFAYPGERLPGETGINYWEAVVRGDRSIGEQFRVAAGYAYSPSVSNTGAWSQYVAAGVGYDVPGRLLPPNLGISFTSAAGYSWFGINRWPSAASHYPPISIGRRVRPSRTRPSTSICATTTPTSLKRAASSSPEIQTRGWVAGSIPSPIRLG